MFLTIDIWEATASTIHNNAHKKGEFSTEQFNQSEQCAIHLCPAFQLDNQQPLHAWLTVRPSLILRLYYWWVSYLALEDIFLRQWLPLG